MKDHEETRRHEGTTTRRHDAALRGLAWPLAVMATVVLFGVGHYYQGPTGMIDTAFSALVFGARTDTFAIVLMSPDRSRSQARWSGSLGAG